jgi:Ca-activated chloride channel family protein
MRALAVAVLVAGAATTATAGSDLPRRAGMYAGQGGQPPSALATVSSDVDVAVHGAIVEVSVAQTFRNDTDRVTEATYIFPLPADAAVSAMAMTLGTRTIHAAVASRGDARKRYEDAVAAGVGAGVLEQERPDVFTQTVSAIPAHGTVAVTLRYDTIARFADGKWTLALPLVVAPRYVPGTASGKPTTGTGARPDTDRAPDASRVTPGSGPGAGGPTRVALHFADAVDDVASPSHALAAQAGGYALTDPHSDHDAIVRWRAHDVARGWAETDGDGGYAAVVVEAPAAKPRAATAHLDITLVLDRSAASLGDADALGHPLVRALADALGARDGLAVAGSDRVARQAPAAALAELERDWTRTAGAFDLTAVLRDLRRDRTGAVVLITGGLVADDAAAIAAATAVGAPIHVIGVGSAPNRALLAAIATASGGTVRFAAPDDDLPAIARDVLADAATVPPALTVNWGALAASDVVPALLPRLGAGQARIVVARVDRARRANARAAGEVFAIEQLAAEPAAAGATSALGPLARRWARDRLDEQLAAAHPDAKAIEAFALRFGLVSPYTAMVAIGDDVVVTGGVKHTVSVPVSVPAGMRWQEVERQDRVEHDGKDVVDEDTEEAKPKREQRAQDQPAPAKNRRHGDDDSNASDDGDDAGVNADFTRKQKGKPDSTKGKADADSSRADATGAPAAQPVAVEATGQDVEELAAVSSVTTRRFGIDVALGGGVVDHGGAVDALGTLAVGYTRALTARTALEVDGALWLAGSDVQGQLVVGAERALPHVEVSGGVGLHLGGGIGPALDLALHVPFLRHFAVVLRYDGALLRDRDKTDGDSAATLGIEWRW